MKSITEEVEEYLSECVCVSSIILYQCYQLCVTRAHLMLIRIYQSSLFNKLNGIITHSG